MKDFLILINKLTMKKTLIILTLCIMASLISFAQSELKNGVYEFIVTTDTDTLEIGGVKVLRSTLTKTGTTTRRTLIVKNDSVLYKIESIEDFGISSFGMFGDYFLNLEKYSDNLYKGKDEYTELNITVIDNNNIEVEVLKGMIMHFYSGGQFFREFVNLPPEKQTLTFVRKLTAEDEEKLLDKK